MLTEQPTRDTGETDRDKRWMVWMKEIRNKGLGDGKMNSVFVGGDEWIWLIAFISIKANFCVSCRNGLVGHCSASVPVLSLSLSFSLRQDDVTVGSKALCQLSRTLVSEPQWKPGQINITLWARNHLLLFITWDKYDHFSPDFKKTNWLQLHAPGYMCVICTQLF